MSNNLSLWKIVRFRSLKSEESLIRDLFDWIGVAVTIRPLVKSQKRIPSPIGDDCLAADLGVRGREARG